MGLETSHSPNADDITTIYWVMLVVAAVIVVAINAALVYFIVRFRGERGKAPIRFRGSGRVQARTATIFALVAAVLFVAGVAYTEEADDVQADPLRVRAVGQQWLWRYEYPPAGGEPADAEDAVEASSPESFADTFSYYELVVPVDRTVVVELDSTDVVHRWWVPELGGKFDAVPGSGNSTWFKADEIGEYEGRSAAFSGTSYAAMRTVVRVVSEADYEKWLSEQAAGIQAAQTSVQQQLAARAGGGEGRGEQAVAEEGAAGEEKQ